MADDEPKFIDAESYQGKGDDKLTFRMIVLEHLRKMGKISCQELRGGYWDERPYSFNAGTAFMRIYVPDTREQYNNAVDFLYDILFPHFDEETKKEMDDYVEWSKEENKRLLNHWTEINDQNKKRIWINEDYYKNDCVKIIKRKLFRLLNSFLYRQKYMEGKSFIDEA